MQLNIQQKVVLLVGFGAILFMLYFLSRSLYQSYSLERKMDYFTHQNQKIEEDIDKIESQVAYYQTWNYRDKYAKEILNKLNPGEKVLVLRGTQENFLIPESEYLQADTGAIKPIDAWGVYFFGEDTLGGRLKMSNE